jgi:Leucine-rich repeat (LRR) protein
LEELYLSYNQLTGVIPLELGNLANLRRLFLDNNQLGGNIPPELGNLTHLEHVNLGWNPLRGSIPPAWCCLSEECWNVEGGGPRLAGMDLSDTQIVPCE